MAIRGVVGVFAILCTMFACCGPFYTRDCSEDTSANECVENEPLENRVQNEQPSVCTAGKFLALTLLACAWTVLCVVVAPVGWHLASLSLRPKGTRISGAAPSAQI